MKSRLNLISNLIALAVVIYIGVAMWAITPAQEVAMTVTPEMVDQATMPDELYAVTGLTTGIATARTLAAEMSTGDLMQHRELLVEMQDAAACALQRLDKHMDDLGRMIRIERVSALATAAPLGEVA